MPFLVPCISHIHFGERSLLTGLQKVPPRSLRPALHTAASLIPLNPCQKMSLLHLKPSSALTSPTPKVKVFLMAHRLSKNLMHCPNQGTLTVKGASVIPRGNGAHGPGSASAACPTSATPLPGFPALLYTNSRQPHSGLHTCCSSARDALSRLCTDTRKCPSYTPLAKCPPLREACGTPLSTTSHLPSLTPASFYSPHSAQNRWELTHLLIDR